MCRRSTWASWRIPIAVIPLGLLASGPIRGHIQVPQIEISMGILVQDSSCEQAQYALIDFCGYLNCLRIPTLCVAVPGNKNVDRFLFHNVRLRGTMEFTNCANPLVLRHERRRQ